MLVGTWAQGGELSPLVCASGGNAVACELCMGDGVATGGEHVVAMECVSLSGSACVMSKITLGCC